MNTFTCWEARGGQPRESRRQSRGTGEDVMHNRLNLCQEAKLMKVWGRGVTMEHGQQWLGTVYLSKNEME